MNESTEDYVIPSSSTHMTILGNIIELNHDVPPPFPTVACSFHGIRCIWPICKSCQNFNTSNIGELSKSNVSSEAQDKLLCVSPCKNQKQKRRFTIYSDTGCIFPLQRGKIEGLLGRRPKQQWKPPR